MVVLSLFVVMPFLERTFLAPLLLVPFLLAVLVVDVVNRKRQRRPQWCLGLICGRRLAAVVVVAAENGSVDYYCDNENGCFLDL